MKASRWTLRLSSRDSDCNCVVWFTAVRQCWVHNKKAPGDFRF